MRGWRSEVETDLSVVGGLDFVGLIQTSVRANLALSVAQFDHLFCGIKSVSGYFPREQTLIF
jgi:hypothetical protein